MLTVTLTSPNLHQYDVRKVQPAYQRTGEVNIVKPLLSPNVPVSDETVFNKAVQIMKTARNLAGGYFQKHPTSGLHQATPKTTESYFHTHLKALDTTFLHRVQGIQWNVRQPNPLVPNPLRPPVPRPGLSDPAKVSLKTHDLNAVVISRRNDKLHHLEITAKAFEDFNTELEAALTLNRAASQFVNPHPQKPLTILFKAIPSQLGIKVPETAKNTQRKARWLLKLTPQEVHALTDNPEKQRELVQQALRNLYIPTNTHPQKPQLKRKPLL